MPHELLNRMQMLRAMRNVFYALLADIDIAVAAAAAFAYYV